MPRLFSYGTLQQEEVQRATFRRSLEGAADALVGYRRSMVAIDDPEVVHTSGKTHHPIVAFTGNDEDRVEGALFEIYGDRTRSRRRLRGRGLRPGRGQARLGDSSVGLCR